MILNQAKQSKCRVFEYKLEAQFRCSGSDGFINWVNNTLEIERTASVLWNLNDKFDFRIVESPEELEKLIKERIQAGATGRLKRSLAKLKSPAHLRAAFTGTI